MKVLLQRGDEVHFAPDADGGKNTVWTMRIFGACKVRFISHNVLFFSHNVR
jgi:hypothetical protein